MKRIYMISRIVLAIIAFLIPSVFILINKSEWSIAPIIIALIVFALSFISTIFAKKIIDEGNKIKNNTLRVLFYILLPIFILTIFFGLYEFVIFIGLDEVLDIGWWFIIVALFVAVVGVLPSIQAIIIIILKKMIKNDTIK